MSKLQNILLEAKTGLSPWEPIPEDKWASVALKCGAAEIEEIHNRIAQLQSELKTVEEWDGDTQDDINKAIYFFQQLAILAKDSQ